MARVHHEDGHVARGKHLACRGDAQLAKRAGVVDAGCVDNDHRTQGQKLHGLADGVGGGSRDVGHDGQLLAGDGVHEA